MQKTNSTNNKKNILIGGFIGLTLCFVLFLFYNLTYFPALEKKYGDTQPQWTILLPTATGHMIPYISHFLIEGSPLIPLFCEATEPVCVSWGAGTNSLCQEPWSIDGLAGCCNEKILSPGAKCSDKVEFIFFVIISIMLCAVYFLIGCLVSWRVIKKSIRRS